MPQGELMPQEAGFYHRQVAAVEAIDEQANHALVRPLAQIREAGSSVSVTWVELTGRHRVLSSRSSARLYYVLTGELTFTLPGGSPTAVRSGELFVIPKGCKYGFAGTGTYLVINTPAFQPGDDEYAE